MPTAAPVTARNRHCRRSLSAPISTITAPESTQFPAIPAYMSSFTSIPSIFNEIPATQRAGRIGGSIDRSNNRVAACVHLVRLVSVNRLNGFVSVDRRHTRGGTRARSLAAMRPISRTRNVSLSLAIVYPPYLLLYTPIPASTARRAPAQAGRRSVHPIPRPVAPARALIPPR